MRSSFAPVLLALAPLVAATTSSKRGLVYIASKYPVDDNIWDNSSSDLTWYYNYGASPTAEYDNSKLQFVPMLWGAPSSNTDMTFYNTVKGLIEGGQNITYVLGFNEPDGCTSGGSCVPADTAAAVWKQQFEPLKRDFNISLGAPAVTGATTGFNWLQNFFTACAALSNSTSNGTSSCEVDFIPVHWYGNFEGLASHIGQVNGTYQNISSIWVTEFADNDVSLTESQTFANQSFSYLDRLSYIGRYSYFGSFRSDVSNVGPNAAFLTAKGKLTDIGSWYLGGAATGNVPTGSASSNVIMSVGWVSCVAASLVWSLL
ncbi:hypothetical protein MBLNU459_g4492t3 [Dothideomycetes sp. NU459]